MSAPGVATLLLAALWAQPLPPELNKQQRLLVDPVLPETLRGLIARASEAELDPRRGTGNAMEIIKAEKPRYAGDQKLSVALDLRLAALVLRSKFLGNSAAPEEVRYTQALSTYSKLDLTDPGLGAWIERTIAHVPEAKAGLGNAKARSFTVAVQTQGTALARDAIFADLKRHLASAGVTLVQATPANASYRIKLAGLEARDEGGRATVRVAMEISGPSAWKTSLFRTTEAKDAKQAVDAAVDWLLRIGGRDVLFHWLTQHGLKGAMMVTPQGDGHDHGHGPATPAPVRVEPPPQSPGSVRIPKISGEGAPK